MTPDDAELRRIFDATTDSLWLLGFDGETLLANQRFADLVGYGLDELGDVSGFAFSDDPGQAQFAAHLEEMRRGDPGKDNEEVLLVRKNGTHAWTLCSWTPVPDESGATVGYLHRMTEYTERRRLRDELQEREALMATTQRVAKLGGWSWDVVRDEVTWSVELYEIFGIPTTTAGANWDTAFDQLHPDDRPGVEAVILNAMRHQDEFHWEARVRTVVPVPRWIRGFGRVTRDEDGVVTRMAGICQDITDLRVADQAADEATHRMQLLQQLAEAANRSTTVADALVRSAQALAEHSAWQPICVFVRTGRGKPLSALELPEPAGPGLPRPDEAAAQESWSARDVAITPVADRPGSSVVSVPVLIGQRVSCVVQLLADVVEPDVYTWSLMRQISDQLSRVAERERAADQLAEARDEAMAASRHKSDFLATMSHEIRTPMNGVIGLNDLLLRTDLDPQQRRLAEGLRGAGLTLLALINDVLDLAKIESGKLELEVTELDVRAVVDQTSLILSGPAQEKGLELVVGCAPDVPRTVMGDPVRFGQVLTNLGSNAVKFTEAGEVVIDVTVEAPSDPATPAGGPTGGFTLRVEVRDTGIGIAEGEVDGLFDAFTQADRSTTRQHGGTGLGLAISRQLVAGMGGQIGARSAPGAGSVFWFTAPFTTADPTGNPTGGSAALSAQPLRRRRVLVIDDNPTAGAFMVRQLSVWNIRAGVATSIDEAFALLVEAAADATPYDLALVDLDMPGVDGLEIGRLLSAHPRSSHLDLVLIAPDGSADEQEVRDAGFRARTTKPVRASGLYDALLDAAARPAPSSRCGRDRPHRPRSACTCSSSRTTPSTSWSRRVCSRTSGARWSRSATEPRPSRSCPRDTPSTWS